jgi:polysaccharide transporter, PST family
VKEQRSFSGAVKWAYLSNWGQRGIGAITTVVLAAILGPKLFGIVAIAMIYILFIQMLLDQGFTAALIQRKNLLPEHLDSIFWLVLSFSCALGLASLGLSRWWAIANHTPILVSVISALSICILLEGLTIVQRALLQRDMDFRSLAIQTNVSASIGGVIGVGMAFAGFGIWALVGQQVIRDFVSVILLWRLSDWRPRLRFSVTAVKQLFGFSASNFLANLSIFANRQADSLLLGLFFGPIAVGLYRFAERVMNTIMNMASSSLLPVSFAEFSRLQDQPEELRRAILKSVRLSAIIAFPALAGLGAASNLIMGVLGPRWSDAGAVLKVFCLAGIVGAARQLFGPVLQALGKPLLNAILSWTNTLVAVSLMIAVALYMRNAPVWEQTVGIATVRLALAIFLGLPVLFFILPKICPVSRRDLAVVFGPALVAAAAVVAAVVVLSLTGAEDYWGPGVGLAFTILVGAAVGWAVLYRLDEMFREIVRKRVFGLFHQYPRAMLSFFHLN